MTTTPVRTFQDILDVLHADPALRAQFRDYVADAALRELPAVVAGMARQHAEFAAATQSSITALADTLNRFMEQTNAALAALDQRVAILENAMAEVRADIAELKERVTRLEIIVAEILTRLDRLEAGQAELRAGQEELRAGQIRHEARLDRLEAGQEELRAGQEELRAGQEELRAGQARLEAGQANLEAGQANFETGQNRLQRSYNRMEGRMGNIIGFGYERHIIRRSRSIFNRFLGMHNPRILLSAQQPATDELTAIISGAVAAGVITPDDDFDLDSADIVGVGETRQGETRYAAVEISETIDAGDLARVRRRAATVAAAASAPALAAVIGKEISDLTRQQASDRQITVIILGDDDDE